ncbi:hypothetical protein LT493_27090 [Streptomyces tricolor]|nr:hypothetical protein [Streptomyces tricolor]
MLAVNPFRTRVRRSGRRYGHDWPPPLRTLVFPIVLALLLTYAVMPGLQQGPAATAPPGSLIRADPAGRPGQAPPSRRPERRERPAHRLVDRVPGAGAARASRRASARERPASRPCAGPASTAPPPRR